MYRWPGESGRPKVYVFHARKSVPKRLRDCISGRFEIVHVEDPWMWTQTDYYVMNSALNHKSEAAAARVGLSPIVLPQMTEYLTKQLANETHDVYVFLASHVGEVPPSVGRKGHHERP
jgi:hypothetical protein